jgi:hypothetical protein
LIARLKSKVGEITMDNELLYAKLAQAPLRASTGMAPSAFPLFTLILFTFPSWNQIPSATIDEVR